MPEVPLQDAIMSSFGYPFDVLEASYQSRISHTINIDVALEDKGSHQRRVIFNINQSMTAIN